MATAPTLVSYTASTFTSSGTLRASVATSSIAVQAGDLLVAVATTEDQGSIGISSVTASGLTWTLRQSVAVSSYAAVSVYTAPVVTSTSLAVTVTASKSNTNAFGVGVYVFRNHGGIGISAKANASGTPSVVLPTVSANSSIVTLNSDWNAVNGSSRSWLTNAGPVTEETYYYGSSIYTVYTGVSIDSGVAGSKTLGLSAPASQKYSIVAIEVLSGGVPVPVADAGPNQSGVVAGSTVSLQGSATNNPTSFAWTQTSGPTITLSDSTITNPTFTAPSSGTVTLNLVASNASGASSPSAVTITVQAAITLHRVWASVPMALTNNNDGTSLSVANSFYVMSGTDWNIIGGRLYVPASIQNTTGFVAKVWQYTTTPNLSVMPLQQVNLPDLAGLAGSYIDFTFPSPVAMTTSTPYWVGYSTNYDYGAATLVNTASIQASDGTPLYLSATSGDTATRAWYTYGNSSSSGYSNAWFGVDVAIAQGSLSPPSASAGPDQTVATGVTVALQGSATNNPTSFAWTQTSGPTVSLSSSVVATPTFTAPAAGNTLVFSFVASNASGSSIPATVTVTVGTVNVYNFPSGVPLTPGAAYNDGGSGYTLGQFVTPLVSGLTATGLRWYAPIAMTASAYIWDETSTVLASGGDVACNPGWNYLPFSSMLNLTLGTKILIGVFQRATQRYTAYLQAWPQSTAQFETLKGGTNNGSRFWSGSTPYLRASDPETDTWYGVDIVAMDGGGKPVANAGVDQTVQPLSGVTLAGSAIGAPTSYAWTQVSGATVTLSSNTVTNPIFTAPADVNGQTLTFHFTATNGNGVSDPDTVNIIVLPQLAWALVGGVWRPATRKLL